MFKPVVDRIKYGGVILGLEEVQAIMNVVLNNNS